MVSAKPLPNFDQDDMQRLLARIEVDGNGCWVVQHVIEGDYGSFKKAGKTYQAHRVAYQMFKGDVPVDRVVDHQCPGRPNRACVNPRHLAVTTHKQNIRNAYPKCNQGHEMRFPNAYEDGGGKRRCVACSLAKLARERAKPKMVPGGTCPKGHVLTWENVYEYVSGGQRQVTCRMCSKERYKAQSMAKALPQMDAKMQRQFFALIKRSPNGGCWEWQGWKKRGYGRYVIDGLGYPAHRIAYQLEHGKIDRWWHVDHLCVNRACCNPAHLEAVTPDENRARARARKPSFNKPSRHKKASRPVKPLFTPPDGHLTVAELADHLGVTAAVIHRWIDRRQMPSYKRNKLRYVDLVEFESWASSRQVKIPTRQRQLTLL